MTCPDGFMWNNDYARCEEVPCPGHNKVCCPDIWDEETQRCVLDCPPGSVADDVFMQCSVPYDDTYTGTMTSGPMCMPHSYVREETACPAGWERVELSHAYMGYSDALSGYGVVLQEDCGCTLMTASETVIPFDMCIPPTDGEIATAAVNASYASYGKWAIGNNCVVTDTEITCDDTRLSGIASCTAAAGCSCQLMGLLTSTGFYLEERRNNLSNVELKQYSSADECNANCAYDCARGAQIWPGFRRALLFSSQQSWG